MDAELKIRQNNSTASDVNNNGRGKQPDDGNVKNQEEDVFGAEMPEPFGMCVSR